MTNNQLPNSTKYWVVHERAAMGTDSWQCHCRYCDAVQSRTRHQIQLNRPQCACRLTRKQPMLTFEGQTLSIADWVKRYPAFTKDGSIRSRYTKRNAGAVDLTDAEVLFGKNKAKDINKDLMALKHLQNAPTRLAEKVLPDIETALRKALQEHLASFLSLQNPDFSRLQCSGAGYEFQPGLTIGDYLTMKLDKAVLIRLLKEVRFSDQYEKWDRLSPHIALPCPPKDVARAEHLTMLEIQALLSFATRMDVTTGTKEGAGA